MVSFNMPKWLKITLSVLSILILLLAVFVIINLFIPTRVGPSVLTCEDTGGSCLDSCTGDFLIPYESLHSTCDEGLVCCVALTPPPPPPPIGLS